MNAVRAIRLLMPLTLLGLISPALPALDLRVGSDGSCSHATLADAFNAIRTLAGTHTIRINKGNYAVPNGLAYTPTVGQNAVFLEGGYPNCSAPAPTGDVTSDADRAVFNGAGGTPGSVLALNINGMVGTFQMRRIVLTGGDATDTAFPLPQRAGGGLAVRGGASVLIGLGTSIKGNAAIDGGGVVLTGSSVSALEPIARIDFYIDEGADISSNTASDRGGGIYCGGAPLVSGANVDRHGSIVFVQGTIGFNQSPRGAALYCRGSIEGGGGLQPRPRSGAAAWILANQSTGTSSGCAAGDATLDASTPAGGDGFRELGAAVDSNGILAITHQSGNNAGLCLLGSNTLGNIDDRPSAPNRYRLRNLHVANQSSEGGVMAVRASSGMQLQVQPSGDQVSCSFFTATPCVAVVDNSMAEVGGFPVPSSLLAAGNEASLNLYRASIRDNFGASLFTATGTNSELGLWSSIIDNNEVRAFSGIEGNTTSLFSTSFGGRARVYQSTVIMRDPLTRFFLLNDNGFATVHASIMASTAAVAPVNRGGTAASTNLTREWCGYFQSTADFGGHSVINDPTTGSFAVLTPASFNLHPTTYAPLSAGLIDACSTPSYDRDFHGLAFNVQLEPGGPVRSDIGAVEAQPVALPDAVFANGFE